MDANRWQSSGLYNQEQSIRTEQRLGEINYLCHQKLTNLTKVKETSAFCEGGKMVRILGESWSAVTLEKI
jgi:hypothetical protein